VGTWKFSEMVRELRSRMGRRGHVKTRVGEETVGARFWEAACFVNGVWLTRAQALWVRASKSTNLAYRGHHTSCCI
jgi:hypothetical protein